VGLPILSAIPIDQIDWGGKINLDQGARGTGKKKTTCLILQFLKRSKRKESMWFTFL